MCAIHDNGGVCICSFAASVDYQSSGEYSKKSTVQCHKWTDAPNCCKSVEVTFEMHHGFQMMPWPLSFRLCIVQFKYITSHTRRTHVLSRLISLHSSHYKLAGNPYLKSPTDEWYFVPYKQKFIDYDYKMGQKSLKLNNILKANLNQ